MCERNKNAKDGEQGSNERKKGSMSEFINGISYVFYHNSYLKYYLFLIILMRIKRNSIDKISCPSFPSRSSDVSDTDALGVKWVVQWISWSSGGEVSDRSWGVGELVEVTLEMSLEGVGLFVSDPALVVLVEVGPGVLEVGIEEAWHISWLKFMGGLEDGTTGELSLILHEELLTGLVSRWGKSLLGEFGEDVVHDLILISSVVSGDVHFLPSSGIHVSAFWLGVIFNSEGNGGTKQSSNGNCEFHAY